jgi:hypothetical protein
MHRLVRAKMAEASLMVSPHRWEEQQAVGVAESAKAEYEMMALSQILSLGVHTIRPLR